MDVSLPDVGGRKAILELYGSKVGHGIRGEVCVVGLLAVGVCFGESDVKYSSKNFPTPPRHLLSGRQASLTLSVAPPALSC